MKLEIKNVKTVLSLIFVIVSSSGNAVQNTDRLDEKFGYFGGANSSLALTTFVTEAREILQIIDTKRETLGHEENINHLVSLLTQLRDSVEKMHESKNEGASSTKLLRDGTEIEIAVNLQEKISEELEKTATLHFLVRHDLILLYPILKDLHSSLLALK